MFRTRWITIQDSGFRAGVARSGYAHDWAELTQDSGLRSEIDRVYGHMSIQGSGFRVGHIATRPFRVQDSGLGLGYGYIQYKYMAVDSGSGLRVRVAQGWGRTLRATPKN